MGGRLGTRMLQKERSARANALRWEGPELKPVWPEQESEVGEASEVTDDFEVVSGSFCISSAYPA